MSELESYIILTEAVTLVAGGFVTLLAVRAYRRTGAPGLRALAIGLGLVTLGGLLGGAVHQLAGFDIRVGVGIQSTFTAIGFTILAYSLYASDATPPAPAGESPPRHERTTTDDGGERETAPPASNAGRVRS